MSNRDPNQPMLECLNHIIWIENNKSEVTLNLYGNMCIFPHSHTNKQTDTHTNTHTNPHKHTNSHTRTQSQKKCYQYRCLCTSNFMDLLIELLRNCVTCDTEQAEINKNNERPLCMQIISKIAWDKLSSICKCLKLVYHYKPPC